MIFAVGPYHPDNVRSDGFEKAGPVLEVFKEFWAMLEKIERSVPRIGASLPRPQGRDGAPRIGAFGDWSHTCPFPVDKRYTRLCARLDPTPCSRAAVSSCMRRLAESLGSAIVRPALSPPSRRFASSDRSTFSSTMARFPEASAFTVFRVLFRRRRAGERERAGALRRP